MGTDIIEVDGTVKMVLYIDDALKRRGPEYRSRKVHASDRCPCGHARELHMQAGGCRASSCTCDVPAAVILPSAA